MALTHAGKVFVVCVAVFAVVAYWLASRMVRRQSGRHGAKGRRVAARSHSGGSCAFAWCRCSSRSRTGSATSSTFWPSRRNTRRRSCPTSEWDTCERRDSDGRTERYQCLKYTSILEAALPDGKRVVMPGNVRSGGAPEIGERIDVVLPPGADQWHERSVRSVGLLAGGAVMVAMIGYFLYLIAAYGAGRNLDGAARFGVAVVMNGRAARRAADGNRVPERALPLLGARESGRLAGVGAGAQPAVRAGAAAVAAHLRANGRAVVK